jgi:hypothetical protein
MFQSTFSLRIIRCLYTISQRKLEYSSISSSLNATKFNSNLKQLIDRRLYKEALDLFDREFRLSTGVTYTLALKACTKLFDHQRGIRIHQQLSSQLLEHPIIRTSLIHFYSKFIFSPLIARNIKDAISRMKYLNRLLRHLFTL